MKTNYTIYSFFILVCLLFGVNIQAQTGISLTLNIETAGTLPDLITSTGIDKNQITSLTLTGSLNGTDIKFIREMAGCDANGNSTSGSLNVLDISGANIVAGGDYYYNNYSNNKYYNIKDVINSYTFYNCSKLTSIILPNSVTSIGDGAFEYCSGLTSITIPSSVTSIGDNAFSDCTGLTSITIPSSVTSIGHGAFEYCKGLTSITIPSSVTSIESATFYGCTGLTSITIPSSVTSIGGWAFEYCKGLTSITIPSSVTSIGDNAFYYCTGLTSITIPSSVTSIGREAFSYCTGLTSITIPSSVTSIGRETFSYCTGLTSITIPSSVTSIGREAFSYCTGLTSITIPNGVTSIGYGAFSDCTSLEDIFVEQENQNFSDIDGVLFNKDKTIIICYPIAKNSNSYTIPSSVTSIGNEAFFYRTGLTSITIPSSVTSIGDWAFAYCKGLTSITIPSSVTSIGDWAFYYCTGLKEIHSNPKNPVTISKYVFGGIDKSACTLYVPVGSLAAYSSAPVWREFSNIVEEEVQSSNPQIRHSNVSVFSEDGFIIVKDAAINSDVFVYNLSGALIFNQKTKDTILKIKVKSGNVYLVKVANETFKIVI